jgi:hypothetical protein
MVANYLFVIRVFIALKFRPAGQEQISNSLFVDREGFFEQLRN